MNKFRDWASRNKTFLSNFIKILGAASFAQLIPFIITPLLSRIYSKEDFGLFGIVYSFSAILMFLGSFRLENALIIDRDKNPTEIFKFIKKITVVTCTVFLVLILVSKDYLAEILDVRTSMAFVMYLVPIIVFINLSYELLIALFNRGKNFNNIAKAKMFQSTMTGFFQLGFGLGGLTSLGLIISPVISKFSTILNFKNIKYLFVRPVFKEEEYLFLKKYKSFPLFDVPTNLINTVSQQLPIFYFSNFFSLSVSGSYFMTQRILQVPVSLISHSILEVFKERLSSVVKSPLLKKKVFMDMFYMILFGAAIPFVFGFIFIEDLLVFILGESWSEAALFAKILCPSVYLKFLSYPLSYLILIENKQQVNLIINIAFFIILAMGLYSIQSTKMAVIFLSLIFSLKALTQILLCFFILKKIEK